MVDSLVALLVMAVVVPLLLLLVVLPHYVWYQAGPKRTTSKLTM